MEVDEMARRMEQLEQRVRLLEEEKAIRDLMTYYSFGADLFRGSPWVDLWVDEGTYDLGGGAAGRPGQRYQGASELMSLIVGPGMPPPGASQHHTDGPLIVRIEGDRAVAEGYSVTFVHRDTGNEVWNMGFSRWTFRRVHGRWRIEERQRREVGDPEQAAVIGTAWMEAAAVTPPGAGAAGEAGAAPVVDGRSRPE